jgi:Ras-related protein Rab-5C
MDAKVVLTGDYSVGKTCLLNRYICNRFGPSESTIGASFRSFYDQETDIRIGLWDTAGSERYNSLLPMYYKGANIIIYCWDSTIKFNAETASEYLFQIRNTNTTAKIILVITKNDLITRTIKEADKWALDHTFNIMYTSAMSGAGIEELFKLIFNMAFGIKNEINNSYDDTELINFINNNPQEIKKCCNIQ